MTPPRSRRPALILLVLLAIVAGLALILAGFFFARSQVAVPLHGAMLNPPRPAVGFTLTGPQDEAVTLYQFRGRLVLLTFAYSECLTPCPAQLRKLAQARSALGAQAADVQVIVVSIDPEHDTAAAFDEYLAAFDAGFLGLSGPPQVIRDLANSYDQSFARRELANGAYQIEHTPLAVLIDRTGRWRATYPLSMSAADITADLKTLLH